VGSKILIAVLLVALAVGLMWLLVGSMTGFSGDLTVAVREGELVVRVEATGKLESDNALRVEARPRDNVLTYLAPEGNAVKKGEVLARFDDAILREQVLTRENDLKMSDARLAQKAEQMAVRKQEIAAQVTMLQADLGIKRAQHELLKSLPHPDDVTRARLERDYRRSRLEIAQQDLEIVRSLSDKGTMIFSKEEVREKELAYAQAKGDLEKAENILTQVLAGAPRAQLDAARRDFVKAEIDLDEAQRRLPQQVTMLEAEVCSAEAEVDKMKLRLERSQRELDKLEVKSPGDGMLVYRTVNGKPLELGAQFWHYTHLFDIANFDNMLVRAKINESEFAQLRVGQPVEIRAFSLPDRIFKGKVKEVAKVAKDKSEGEVAARGQSKAGIQAFDVLVSIDRSDPFLRPNVEAEVVILCEDVPNTLSIPVDAVFEQDGRKWVRVLDGHRPRPREVTLGVRAGDWIQVTKGLKAGERVLLRVPSKGSGDQGNR
jgi:HlyD family secretion protein